jgi:hypothetical protein
MAKLSSKKITELKEALNFLHVKELKNIAVKLSIPINGKKGNLIARIVYFINTGIIVKEPILPKISCAKSGEIYPLKPNSLILKGAYKNDLKTRQFFKKLIGEYFHFTAFGVDWLNERWLAGKPPTYQEFADMWKKEYVYRKQQVKKPKEEWAYISFSQKFMKENPSVKRSELLKAWAEEINKKRQLVKQILG